MTTIVTVCVIFKLVTNLIFKIFTGLLLHIYDDKLTLYVATPLE